MFLFRPRPDAFHEHSLRLARLLRQHLEPHPVRCPPRANPAIPCPRSHLPQVASRQTWQPKQQASLLTGAGTRAPVVAMGITPPVLVPDGFLAIEPIDQPDSRPWTPPTWFPEDEADALWALEGIDGEPTVDGGAPRLRSRSAFVYDIDSGRVLLSKAGDTRRPVASLTKVVSALTLGRVPDMDANLCIDSSRPEGPVRSRGSGRAPARRDGTFLVLPRAERQRCSWRRRSAACPTACSWIG